MIFKFSLKHRLHHTIDSVWAGNVGGGLYEN